MVFDLPFECDASCTEHCCQFDNTISGQRTWKRWNMFEWTQTINYKTNLLRRDGTRPEQQTCTCFYMCQHVKACNNNYVPANSSTTTTMTTSTTKESESRIRIARDSDNIYLEQILWRLAYGWRLLSYSLSPSLSVSCAISMGACFRFVKFNALCENSCFEIGTRLRQRSLPQQQHQQQHVKLATINW